MDDKLLEKIKTEAEAIDIPESLSPENIRQKLDDMDNEPKETDNKKVKPFSIRRFATVAASVAVVLGIGSGLALYGSHNTATTKVSTDTMVSENPTNDTISSYSIPGVMHSALDYSDIGEVITEARAEYENEMKLHRNMGVISNDIIEFETATDGAVSDTAIFNKSMDAGIAAGGAVSAEASHSDTNTRTGEVDEGDIVKTDGKYIYQYFSNGRVRIVSIDKGQLHEASSFKLSDKYDAYVAEMYVRDEQMVLIAELYESSLSKGKRTDMPYYYINNNRSIHVLTYDISDRTSPKKTGDVTIDGYYNTSRMADGYLYVMTTYGQPMFYYCGLGGGIMPEYKTNGSASTGTDSNDVLSGEKLDALIPKINGEKIPASNIMLPEKPKDEPFYVITSIKLDAPNDTVDSKAIMGYVDQVYASAHSLFFYSVDYSGNHERTEIVKFSYKDGLIVPEAAGSVRGVIDDSFCIDEDKNGNLRVATSTWHDNGTQESSLYILDPNMEKIGSILDFAGNEGIKSCRFMGDVGYMVTFRNTDPLFTIDLSDPTNPQIISELTLPGFSEYLHYWGNGLLLGVGYDADVETGGTEGVKLSMFDVSDPKKPREVAKLVLDADSSDLLYGDYKSILIDPEKNLFGFSCSDWGDEDSDWEEKGYYMLFSYENGAFHELLTSKLNLDNGYWSEVRGVYAGDYFYLVHGKKITSYDMSDYKKIAVL